MQLYVEGAALLCFQCHAGDVTIACTGLLQARTAPAFSDCPGKRRDHLFFLLRIWECLHRQGGCHWYFKRKADLCLLFTDGETNVQAGEVIWLSHP